MKGERYRISTGRQTLNAKTCCAIVRPWPDEGGRQTFLTGELALPAEQAMDAEFVLAPPPGGMNDIKVG